MERRVIAVGDIHGCLEEFDELMKLVEFKQGADNLWLVGDLVDRGPASQGVLQRAREIGAKVVRGNHEEWYIKRRRHYEKNRLDPQHKLPKPPPLKEAIYKTLKEEDFEFIETMPVMAEIVPGWMVVHAGFEPSKPAYAQDGGSCVRIRYVDKDGNFAKVGVGESPGENKRWAERWPGRENVIYGHAVYSLDDPQIDNPVNGVTCYGIDTGCSFGGNLTALMLFPESGQVSFATVRNKVAYADWRHPED